MPEERIYYRHAREGQRGYLVTLDGKKYIRFDRPLETIDRPFRDGEWVLDRETRPLNAHQAGRIAFEADKAACIAFGQHDESRREWQSLTDEKRIAWMVSGPPSGPRQELFRLIMKWSKKYTG